MNFQNTNDLMFIVLFVRRTSLFWTKDGFFVLEWISFLFLFESVPNSM